jgi:hypothetical protein
MDLAKLRSNHAAEDYYRQPGPLRQKNALWSGKKLHKETMLSAGEWRWRMVQAQWEAP